jgi:two-component system NarL family sensor kinase
VRELATALGPRADGPLAVTVEAELGVEGLPAAVEVAAYRIATEALTNVVRHSTASAARVRFQESEGGLEIHVHDDGVNPGCAERVVEQTVAGVDGGNAGLGLSSIRERATELGGWYTFTFDRTGGRVSAFLPVARPRRPTSALPSEETR